ncbi:MAG: hypothetical protein KME38_21455 [Spirirestis rafaelensis WJT71-NPBG6]|nr:hypothetical protein [Spirirestis rafaelensis WJT71-NPBG6]
MLFSAFAQGLIHIDCPYWLKPHYALTTFFPCLWIAWLNQRDRTCPRLAVSKARYWLLTRDIMAQLTEM